MPERLRGLREIDPPTWALGLLVAALTFPVAFVSPIFGLDPSWAGGLYMATHEGLNFGTEVVYTFGPLGFLFSPQLWFSDLAVLSFCFATVLWASLACSLVWAVRRGVGALAAVIIVFLLLALLPDLEDALVVAVIWSLASLRPDRPRYAIEALAVGGGAFAAVEALIKLSVGPPVLAVVLLALIGARARLWQLALSLAVFAVTFGSLWLVSGGSLSEVPDYLANGSEIVSGYSQALADPTGSGWERLAVFASLLLVVVGAAFGSYRDQLALLCGLLIVAIAGFAIFKEGVVRSEPGHLTIAMATMVAIWLALPWSPGRGGALVGGALVLGAVALQIQPGTPTNRLNAIANLGDAGSQIQTLFSSSRREEIRASAAELMRSAYALDEQTQAALQGHSVQVSPWEIGVAWAYGLNWAPVPVFQNYTAYTTELDELNAAAIAAPSGPERILRERLTTIPGVVGTRSLDGRFAGWDPPAQARATLCNFEPLHTGLRWQVLGRVPNRCGQPRLIGSVESTFGATVDVPRANPDEVVFLRVDGVGVDGFEALRTLLYRGGFRFALVDGDQSYRLVPGTASDGLLMNGDSSLIGAGAWALAPQASTISILGSDGDLRYDFYSMAVARTRPVAGRGS